MEVFAYDRKEKQLVIVDFTLLKYTRQQVIYFTL